jgi:hypothetical protein
MKVTRRQLAAAIAATPLVAARAQAPQPNPAQPPADDLQAARDRLQANARALAAVPVPMSTEPAVVFKA